MDSYIPLGIFGISHKTAPVEIREQVALSEGEQGKALAALTDSYDIDGCLIVSTCNRTEIYVTGEEYLNEIPKIKSWLDAFKKCSYFSDSQYTYSYSNHEAVRHFFEMISGLDSQIVGEPQITGQVKESYARAFEKQVTGTLLNKLFTFGLQTEKKIRSETFLTEGAVSVSFAGVELARKIFNKLEYKQVLLIGAGETAELAALHFIDKGIQTIHIANRTLSKAEELAERFSGLAYPLSDVDNILEKVDIVISATASTEFVLTKKMMASVSRNRHYKPIFLIDLAIPRDIDPRIDRYDGVYLYNLDDLNEIVQMNMDKRRDEIPKSLKIVSEFEEEFEKWLSTHSMASTIGRLKDYFEQIRKKELDRLRKRLPNNGYEEIDYLTQSIVNKLMHQHIKSLKRNAADPERYQQHVDFVYNLYDIEEE